MIFSPGKILPARIASRNCTARFSFSSPRDSELISGKLFSTLITVNCTISRYALLTVGLFETCALSPCRVAMRRSRRIRFSPCTSRRDNPCRLFSRRGKLLFTGDALSLFNSHDLAGGNPREIVDFAIRPAYRYIGRGRFAQTEVDPKVALRDEGPPPAGLVILLVTAGG